MAYFKHRLGKTFYISKGRNGKTPLLCLHGGPGSGHHGLLPLFKLAKERKVIVFDQLGCGKSSPVPKKYWTMKSFAENLEQLAKHLKLESFYLFGVSCGSTLALEYYLRYPKRVRGIIFQSSFLSTKDWMADAVKWIKKMDGKNKKILLDTIARKKIDS